MTAAAGVGAAAPAPADRAAPRGLLRAAITVEARKSRSSHVMLWTTVLFVVGIGALTLGILAAVASGEEQVIAKLGPLAGVGGWAGLVGIVVQITAAGGLGAFGIALSWMFGREFADGTVAALFALPVPRAAIALGKLIVYAIWAVVVAVLLTFVVAGVGLVLGYGATDAAGFGELARLPLLVVLTALIAVPAAWASTIGRGLLPGIATTIGIIVVAQVLAIADVGEWVPIVAPALWAIAPDTTPAAVLLTVPSVPLVFGALCTLAWSRLQLDR
jgi:ABC-2 type transport system permease protein